MNNDIIKALVSQIIPQTKVEGDKLKKMTVKDTYHIGGLSGNRLNSGTLRSQFIICAKESVWNNSDDSAKKAIHSDQRVFVQKDNDIWDVYRGKSLDGENELPELMYENTPNLKELIKKERQTIFKQNSSTKEQQENTLKENSNLRYLTALRTKPFMLLAGISGTGKSRIVRKLAQATVTEDLQCKYDENYSEHEFENSRWDIHKPANFEIIQVKPNWHNSMDVVGYLSNIPSPHYVFTPFVNFIVKAWTNPDIPFFLCLDEMNLAPVEEYFAEFLSAIESRSNENGEYTTDPIIKPFNEFGNGIAVNMIKELNDMLITPMGDNLENKFRNKGLSLPSNLIVIGTVNMDETTFSFSRKVLDRAMSIEMNEVDYMSFLNEATDDEIKYLVSKLSVTSLNKLLVTRHIEAKEVIDQLGGTGIQSDAMFVIAYLDRINKLLDGTPFKLGYRASNEALIYLAASKDFGKDDILSALDEFTLMKILSRIEGDESKLRITSSAADQKRLQEAGLTQDGVDKSGELNILTALKEIIQNQLGKNNLETIVPTESVTEDTFSSPISSEEKKNVLKSIKKLDYMISQLERDHFVSYWN